MLEVGDLVKYKNEESIYRVEFIDKSCVAKLLHLKSGKIYKEEVLSRLIKLKFKIGDKVKILTRTKDDIATITNAYVSLSKGLIYYTIKEEGTHYLETSLELVTPKFKKGDLVYIDSIKTFLSGHHYKVFQVLEVSNKKIICSDSDLKRVSFNEKSLIKFKFQPNDVVQVTNICNSNYKKIFAISSVRFNNTDIEYCSNGSNIWYAEFELSKLSEYTLDTTAAENIAIKINDSNIEESISYDVKVDKSVYDSFEKKVSEIIDTYINNNNLNNKQNDENRLQEERTLELGRDEQERVGIHGRRHQVAVRECYQRYEAGFSKIKKHSIRVKDQLSTSYSRTYGSKD